MNENKLMNLIDVCNFLKINHSDLFEIQRYDINFPRQCMTIGESEDYFRLGDILS